MPTHSSRHDDILAVYDKYGGMLSLRRLTHLCAEEGVWTADEQRQMAFQAMRRECQTALQTKNSLGLPVAGPSPRKDGNAPIWVQLTLWDEETSLFNMALRIRGMAKDYDTLECLWRHHVARWGHAPPIPRWSFPDDEPMWWYDQPESGDPAPLDDDD
jgi:hypothetical protein